MVCGMKYLILVAGGVCVLGQDQHDLDSAKECLASLRASEFHVATESALASHAFVKAVLRFSGVPPWSSFLPLPPRGPLAFC